MLSSLPTVNPAAPFTGAVGYYAIAISSFNNGLATPVGLTEVLPMAVPEFQFKGVLVTPPWAAWFERVAVGPKERLGWLLL